jgi:hypothetical protein
MLLCVEYGDGKTSYLVAEPSMLKETRHKASKKGGISSQLCPRVSGVVDEGRRCMRREGVTR